MLEVKDKMKVLYPSFAPPEKWRNSSQAKKLEGEAWRRLRSVILEKGAYTCVYCGYSSPKFQIVDHIDGDPENNANQNLQVVCQMCNLVKHSGHGCEIQGVVDLYRYSNYSQNEVIQIARKMRDKGAADGEIITFLGLLEKVPFKMDRFYLRKLYGFVSSRPPRERDMYWRWLEYQKSPGRNNEVRHSPKSLVLFT